MADLVLAFPGELSTRTGGYAYDRRVLSELASRRRTAVALGLPKGFPSATRAEIDEALRRLAAVPRESALVVDGLAFGALPATGLAALDRPVAALVHHPLACETGLDPAERGRLEASEKAALAAAAAVVATSATTAATLRARFGVPADKLLVAEPGVEEAERAPCRGDPPVVLTVGTVTPRKNHVALAMALGAVRDLGWRWRVVGSLERDPACATRLEEAIAAAGIGDRTDLLGEVDDRALAREYAGADLFALPSRFEGYGMAYAEALARGLPVIAGAGGASAETVPAAAGAVVAPDDPGALAAALHRLIGDRDARRAASGAAWAHAATLPRWEATAEVFERVAARLS